jgi:uncharacterized protein (TIGR02996 family)
MKRNHDLERRILADPKDRDAYAVYGNWLSQQGDPRGGADEPGWLVPRTDELAVAIHERISRLSSP